MQIFSHNLPILFDEKLAARSLTDFFSESAPSVIPTTHPPSAAPALIATMSISKNEIMLQKYIHKNSDLPSRASGVVFVESLL